MRRVVSVFSAVLFVLGLFVAAGVHAHDMGHEHAPDHLHAAANDLIGCDVADEEGGAAPVCEESALCHSSLDLAEADRRAPYRSNMSCQAFVRAASAGLRISPEALEPPPPRA